MAGPADNVFTLTQRDRERALLPLLAGKVEHHRARCLPYARILRAMGYESSACTSLANLPWLPVRLFKNHRLVSVPDTEVFTTVTSSGTTGTRSQICLDRQAASDQQRALAATLRAVVGGERRPMLVVETKSLLDRSKPLSARGAGVIGMMGLGREHVFVLDQRESPDAGAVRAFLARHGGRPFVIFGLTFMVWTHLYRLACDERLDLSQGILLHSGGWKRLSDTAVDNSTFRRRLAEQTGLSRVHNYYGMAEQLGTLYLEGPAGGDFYCPDFADVIIRNPDTWAEQAVGVPGVIEVMSTLPTSYPGNVLLTEDIGVVNGVDDGEWPGKRFSVLGRLPAAEVRGCGNTVGVAG